MKLIETLSRRKRIVLNICGVLEKRTINSFYLNLCEKENQKCENMINVFVEDPLLCFNSMLLYLLLQLSYSPKNVYIPFGPRRVSALRTLIDKQPLVDHYRLLVASGKRHGFNVLFTKDKISDIQVLRKDELVEINALEYANLYRDLIMSDSSHIENMENLIDDEYVEHLKGVLYVDIA